MAPCGWKTVGCSERPILPLVLAQSSRTGTFCNNGGGVHWARPVLLPAKRNNATKPNAVGVLARAPSSNGPPSKSSGERNRPGSRISGIFTQATEKYSTATKRCDMRFQPKVSWLVYRFFDPFLLIKGRTDIQNRSISGKLQLKLRTNRNIEVKPIPVDRLLYLCRILPGFIFFAGQTFFLGFV
jgi:hypothetical protein